MANPQLEDGFVAIAYDLFAAIAAAKISALEKEVVLAVIYFTYGSGKTRAAIDIDDIQVFVAGERRIRRDRVAAAVNGLIEKHVLYAIEVNQYQTFMGVQKDFEKWGKTLAETAEGIDRESGQKFQLLRKSNINNINTITSKRDKLSILQEYAYRNTHFSYGKTVWGVERAAARKLYREALQLTGDPVAAAVALKDYIDWLRGQEWFEAKVKMRMTFMYSRFKQWYKSIPAKPRDIKEQEELTGMRYQYNLNSKRWEVCDAR